MGSLPQLSIIKGPQSDFNTRLRINRIFESNIEKYSKRPAILFNNQNISYNELNQKANRIARSILQHGKSQVTNSNPDGDWIVAICVQPTDILVTVLLSIWKAGAAYLPLDPHFPASRIQHITNESKPFLIVYQDDVDKTVFKDIPSISISQLLQESSKLSDANIPDEEILKRSSNNTSDLGLVLYTSGSTGIPKGVRLPQSIVLNRLQWQWERFPYTRTETIGVFKTALTFVDSVSEIWGPLLNGMALLIINKEVTKNPEKLVQMLEEYKIERLVLVPTLLHSLLMYLSLNKNRKYLYNLKSWICSGEALTVGLAQEFFDYFQEGVHRLFNFYGSTEVMGDVTYFVCESKKQLADYEKVPIGYPINNTVIHLLDHDYRPVKNGEIGEIFVSGLNLAEGYVNGRDPHRFIENPWAVDSKYSKIYRTGDYGSVNKGVIMYEGRTDSQIKIRGHRVDLSEVEKNLFSIESIDRGIVLCYHAGEIDQSLLAFVKLTTPTNIKDGQEIENELQKKLPDYMIPQVRVLETIPLLVNGKIDRQHLLKLHEESNNNNDSGEHLSFDLSGVPEKKKAAALDLFEVIRSVIGKSARTSISLASNFYELGGNSLNSIFTVTQLRDRGYFIGITDFITAKTLGEILDKMTNNSNIEALTATSCNQTFQMISEPLKIHHKTDTIDIITTSFYEKADLERWLKPDILVTDYSDILEDIWDVLVEKDLSFVVKDDNDQIIGVALNFDALDEPEVAVKSKLSIVFDFLEFVEGPIRDNQLPKGLNKIIHSFMMGTSQKLSAQENIAVMHFMEDEVLQLAKRKRFAGIFTTNTNPLTQQLGSDVYKYKTMLDYQVNKYVHTDGSKPFASAPDSQRAIVHWKDISLLH